MPTHISIFEQFMILFHEVKRCSGFEPSRIKTLYNQHADLKKAVDLLTTFLLRSDFKRRVFHGNRKYHKSVPVQFSDVYREYDEYWATEVTLAGLDLPDFNEIQNQSLEEFLDEAGNKALLYHTPFETTDGYERPDPEYESEFDPLRHDGGKAIEMALWITQSYAEEPEETMDSIHAASRIGIEAFDYLCDTIGLDFHDVFKRWRIIPTIFMPAHVSNMHGSGKRGSLFELLDDATKAFVFGAPAAAIAACRAALEMVLKQHYEIEYRFQDKNGKTREKGLGELILVADEKYSFIQGKRLQRLTNSANKIMHSYSRTKPLTKDDESVILDFFRTLKFLIERAPNP